MDEEEERRLRTAFAVVSESDDSDSEPDVKPPPHLERDRAILDFIIDQRIVVPNRVPLHDQKRKLTVDQAVVGRIEGLERYKKYKEAKFLSDRKDFAVEVLTAIKDQLVAVIDLPSFLSIFKAIAIEQMRKPENVRMIDIGKDLYMMAASMAGIFRSDEEFRPRVSDSPELFQIHNFHKDAEIILTNEAISETDRRLVEKRKLADDEEYDRRREEREERIREEEEMDADNERDLNRMLDLVYFDKVHFHQLMQNGSSEEQAMKACMAEATERRIEAQTPREILSSPPRSEYDASELAFDLDNVKLEDDHDDFTPRYCPEAHVTAAQAVAEAIAQGLAMPSRQGDAEEDEDVDGYEIPDDRDDRMDVEEEDHGDYSNLPEYGAGFAPRVPTSSNERNKDYAASSYAVAAASGNYVADADDRMDVEEEDRGEYSDLPEYGAGYAPRMPTSSNERNIYAAVAASGSYTAAAAVDQQQQHHAPGWHEDAPQHRVDPRGDAWPGAQTRDSAAASSSHVHYAAAAASSSHAHYAAAAAAAVPPRESARGREQWMAADAERRVEEEEEERMEDERRRREDEATMERERREAELRMQEEERASERRGRQQQQVIIPDRAAQRLADPRLQPREEQQHHEQLQPDEPRYELRSRSRSPARAFTPTQPAYSTRNVVVPAQAAQGLADHRLQPREKQQLQPDEPRYELRSRSKSPARVSTPTQPAYSTRKAGPPPPTAGRPTAANRSVQQQQQPKRDPRSRTPGRKPLPASVDDGANDVVMVDEQQPSGVPPRHGGPFPRVVFVRRTQWDKEEEAEYPPEKYVEKYKHVLSRQDVCPLLAARREKEDAKRGKEREDRLNGTRAPMRVQQISCGQWRTSGEVRVKTYDGATVAEMPTQFTKINAKGETVIRVDHGVRPRDKKSIMKHKSAITPVLLTDVMAHRLIISTLKEKAVRTKLINLQRYRHDNPKKTVHFADPDDARHTMRCYTMQATQVPFDKSVVRCDVTDDGYLRAHKTTHMSELTTLIQYAVQTFKKNDGYVTPWNTLQFRQRTGDCHAGTNNVQKWKTGLKQYHRWGTTMRISRKQDSILTRASAMGNVRNANFKEFEVSHRDYPIIRAMKPMQDGTIKDTWLPQLRLFLKHAFGCDLHPRLKGAPCNSGLSHLVFTDSLLDRVNTFRFPQTHFVIHQHPLTLSSSFRVICNEIPYEKLINIEWFLFAYGFDEIVFQKQDPRIVAERVIHHMHALMKLYFYALHHLKDTHRLSRAPKFRVFKLPTKGMDKAKIVPLINQFNKHLDLLEPLIRCEANAYPGMSAMLPFMPKVVEWENEAILKAAEFSRKKELKKQQDCKEHGYRVRDDRFTCIDSFVAAANTSCEMRVGRVYNDKVNSYEFQQKRTEVRVHGFPEEESYY